MGRSEYVQYFLQKILFTMLCKTSMAAWKTAPHAFSHCSVRVAVSGSAIARQTLPSRDQPACSHSCSHVLDTYCWTCHSQCCASLLAVKAAPGIRRRVYSVVASVQKSTALTGRIQGQVKGCCSELQALPAVKSTTSMLCHQVFGTQGVRLETCQEHGGCRRLELEHHCYQHDDADQQDRANYPEPCRF